MGNIVYGSNDKQPTEPAPRWVRWCVLVFELGLVLIIAYQMAQLTFLLWPGDAVRKPPALAVAGAKLTERDISHLVSFDPFFRRTATDSEIIQNQVVPESTLRLEVFGLRATGGGKGSAIIRMQDGDQTLVEVGAELAPGIRLVGVYMDRMEVSRAGTREAIFMRPQAERGLSSGSNVSSRHIEGSGRRKSGSAPPLSADAQRIISGLVALELTAVRRERHIVGFKLPDILPALVQPFGFEGGDILLAANGARLNSYERLQEFQDEMSSVSKLSLQIERRGEKRLLIIDLKEPRK